MASLSGGGNLGTGNVSALIRSANTTANEMLTLDTNIADQQWNDSAKTDADYKAYTTSINGILSKAQGNTTITGQDRVLSLQNKLTSAGNAYNSAQIKRAQINILQGTGTQSDKVNLLAQLYSHASDPADQQSVLEQYDQAVKTLNDQNAAAVTKAQNAATSAASRQYTATNTMLTTLTSQLAASLKTGTNQISPALLTGNHTFFADPKTGTLSANQTAGSVPVNVSVPAPGAAITEHEYLNLYSAMKQLQYSNNVQASNDPNLTAPEQAAHANTAAGEFSNMQSDLAMNTQLLNATNDQMPAFVRSYVNGVAELKANPNVDAAGRYMLNPSTQSINASLAAAKAQDAKTGTVHDVTFNMMVNGFATQYKLRNMGNTVIALDPTNQFTPEAKTYLWDAQKGTLVPFSQQGQEAFNHAYLHGGDLTGIVNQVAHGYQVAQHETATGNTTAIARGNQPGASMGDIAKGMVAAVRAGVPNVIHLVASKAGLTGQPSPTHDPLGRLGHGIVGELGKSISGAAVDIRNFLGKLVGAKPPQAITSPVTHSPTKALPTPGTKPLPAPAPLPAKTPTPAPAVTHSTKTTVQQPSLIQGAEHAVGNVIQGAENIGKAVGSALGSIF